MTRSVFEDVSRVGQGTWNIEQDDRKTAIRALQRGIELGLGHIDTAEMYGSGKAEQIVAEAIKGRRDEVFIVSKVLPRNASYTKTVRACENSLARLGIERLDCYLLHWREDEPLAETFRAFEKLQADGKIRSWGVSNFDVGDLEEAERIADKGKMACNQVLYNIWERAIEHRVLPWCKEHGVPAVAYSPFSARPGFDSHAVLDKIARAHDTTPRVIALRFLVQQGTWIIPKASKVPHVEENAKALTVELSADEMARIDEAFPKGRSKSLPML